MYHTFSSHILKTECTYLYLSVPFSLCSQFTLTLYDFFLIILGFLPVSWLPAPTLDTRLNLFNLLYTQGSQHDQISCNRGLAQAKYHAVSFLRISSCILLIRETWEEMRDLYEVSRNYHTIGQTQEESNKSFLFTGNTEHIRKITEQVYSGLGTDNYNPIWWQDLGSQDLKQLLPIGLGPRPLWAFPCILLSLEKE